MTIIGMELGLQFSMAQCALKPKVEALCYGKACFANLFWINVRDPLYFLGCGIPYIYVKRILFSP